MNSLNIFVFINNLQSLQISALYVFPNENNKDLNENKISQQAAINLNKKLKRAAQKNEKKLWASHEDRDV